MPDEKAIIYDPLVWAAAFSGAVASLIGLSQISLRIACVYIIVGTCTAAFLTPLVILLISHMDSPAWIGATGFILGVAGLNVIHGIVNLATKFKDDPIGTTIGWLQKLRGSGNGSTPNNGGK